MRTVMRTGARSEGEEEEVIIVVVVVVVVVTMVSMGWRIPTVQVPHLTPKKKICM